MSVRSLALSVPPDVREEFVTILEALNAKLNKEGQEDSINNAQGSLCTAFRQGGLPLMRYTYAQWLKDIDNI